jgi:hypothetical protein
MLLFEEDTEQIQVVNEVGPEGRRTYPAGDGEDKEDDDSPDSE